MVHPVVHIAKDNVCLGAVSGMKHFHAKLLAADSSSNQRRVENDGLHEAVLGATKHFIFLRLLHAPRGVGSGVNQKALVISVNEQRETAGHDKISDLLPFVMQINLHIGKV